MRVCLLSVVLALGLVAACQAQSPSTAAQAAAADVLKVPADRRPYTRYLSLYHVSDRKQLDQWDAVLAFWVNSLSRESEIVRPRQIAPGLWRVDLGDYQWDTQVWEKLADAPEPYFHVQLVEIVQAKPARTVREWWPGGVNPADKRHYNAGWYDAQYPAVEASRKVKSAIAPWIDGAAAKVLFAATGSQIPIVRADWWLSQTAIALDRRAGYYDWLGLGKAEKDFQSLLGADVKTAQRLRKESRAVVSRSIVTLNNRSMARVPTLTGAYWFTQDFARSADVKNPLRLIDGDAEPDASEQYGTLPNGLYVFWLQNGKTERQDTAPDSIASDGQSRGTDKRVHVGLSCVRCHIEGIRPINDWARKVYQPPFKLDSPDYETAKRLRSQYLSDLAGQVKRDQADYAAVLKSVNGLTPGANAKAIADAWDWYTERDRTLADVAGELGVKVDTLTEALKAEAKRTQLDPILAGLLQGADARVEHVEEIFALAQEILGRHKP